MKNTPSTLQPSSWVPLDPNYGNRNGYDAGFLGVPVPPPALKPELKALATAPVLPYQHFSILMNPARKLAFWTAVNIDGQQERHLGDRKRDAWWFDERTPQAQQVGGKFYAGSGFQRGHLVRRLDPAWGPTEVHSGRGEADTFHWTNCSPQMPQLNTQWWLAVENHVLLTANARDLKVSVFTGCLFTDDDPRYREVQIPLAFWKVCAWVVTERHQPVLRSLAFLVKQDEAVAALLKKRGVQPLAVPPLAVHFDDLPESIQGYQVTVAELQRLTQCRFGELASPEVDVYARKRSTRLAPQVFNTIDTYRRLGRPTDLITR